MRVIVKFRSMINVIWGTPIRNRQAFAYMRGFPATFFLTERRIIVLGEFTEKMGWLRKAQQHRIIFEANLEYMKEYKINLLPRQRIFTGFISFHAHNQLAEGAQVQFLKMRPDIGKSIDNYLKDLSIQHGIEDSGIVLIDEDVPPFQEWLNKRFGKKEGAPKIEY